jgi:hypothetical protein
MTGHIRRRGERSWELKFDIGTDPQTGKRLTRHHSFEGTKREAEAELIRLKAGVDRGEYVDPSKLTVSEFLDRWEGWAAGEVLNLLGKGLGVHPRLIGESTRFGVRTDLDDGAPRWRGYRHPSGRART